MVLTESPAYTVGITTNHRPRPVFYPWELSDAQLDQVTRDTGFTFAAMMEHGGFALVRYQGRWYANVEFQVTDPGPWNNSPMIKLLHDAGWDGYFTNTMNAGVLIRFPADDPDGGLAIMGRFVVSD